MSEYYVRPGACVNHVFAALTPARVGAIIIP